MINGKRAISIFLLTLSILSVQSCNRQTPAERKAIFVKRVNELVGIAIKRFGDNRQSVQAILGAPSTSAAVRFTNQHNPKQTDQIHTLTYKGLIVRIYDIPSFKKEMLLSVRLTENRPGLLPELIGQSEKSIKDKFGDPTSMDGTVFIYMPIYNINESGEDVVKMEFNNSIVSAVEWDYYVD
jgi:hypothetical protein